MYLLGQVVPGRAGAARPWLRAGPIRAWSFDFGGSGAKGVEPAMWVCCAGLAVRLTQPEA